MPSKVSESLIDPLRNALEIAEKAATEAEATKSTAIVRAKEARNELQKVRTALSRFDPDYKPEPQPSRKKKKNGNGLSLERLEMLVAAMRKLSKKDDYFTQNGVRVESHVNPAQTSHGFNLLREIGFIRKGGKVEGSTADKWAIMDEGALKRYMEEHK